VGGGTEGIWKTGRGEHTNAVLDKIKSQTKNGESDCRYAFHQSSKGVFLNRRDGKKKKKEGEWEQPSQKGITRDLHARV